MGVSELESSRIPEAPHGTSKLRPRAQSPAALDDSLADCETGDEGEQLGTAVFMPLLQGFSDFMADSCADVEFTTCLLQDRRT